MKTILQYNFQRVAKDFLVNKTVAMRIFYKYLDTIKIVAKHFIRKPIVSLVAVTLLFGTNEAFATFPLQNLLTTFNNYSPASQIYCGTVVDIVGNYNYSSNNCGGNPAPTYQITWYYNTTNSVIVAGATQVQQSNEGATSTPVNYTLLAANIVAPPAGVTYYYFFTATYVSGCGSTRPTSQPATTATVWNPGANMSYSSSTTTQTISLVEVNTTDNDVIGIQVVTTGACNPLDATSFTFVITGTTLASDITNAKLYYTANSSTFATGTQLGATVATPPASPTTFTISGFTQTLAGGTDYFWLSYDVPTGATVGNVIDAECPSFIFDGITRTPTTTAPAGSRTIVGTPWTYCSIATTGTGGTPPYIDNVTLNTISNLGTGRTGATTYYNDYFSTISTTVGTNALYTLSVDANVATAGCCYQTTYIQAFIDLNNDGDFADANETVGQASGIGVTGDRVVHLNTAVSFWGATSSISRMRVVTSVTGYYGPCGTTADEGEIEDYKVIIDPLPSHCSNTITDGGETTADCGGNDCGPYTTITMSPPSPAIAACGAGAYTLTASNTLSKGSEFQWQFSPDNSTWYDLGGAGALTYSGTAYSTTYFRARVPGGSCPTYYTPSLSITITGTVTNTWQTTGTSSWSTGSNWSQGTQPTSCHDVTIPSGGTQPIISSTANVRSLTVNSGAIIDINSTLNIYGDLLNNGNMDDAGGFIDLYGSGNTWGGTGTFLNGAAQAGKFRIRDGANYTLLNDMTILRINPSCLTSTGRLSLGSNTLVVTLQFCNTFYLHYNTGVLEMRGGGSVDVSKSLYETGTLHINWTGAGCGSATSFANCLFDLEDDYYNVWFSCTAGEYIKFGNDAITVQVANDHWIVTGGLSHVKAGANVIAVGGDWINDGVFAGGTAVVEMNGSKAQNITSNNGTVTTFNGLTINNISSGVTLQVDANTNTSSSGILTLTDGALILNENRLTVQFDAIGSITGGSSSSYIVSETNAATNNSILQWNIGSTTGDHVFPFGTTTGDYIPVTFNNNGNASGNVSISTRPTALNDNQPWTTGVTSMAGPGTNITSAADRWWDISSAAVASDVTFSYLGTENATTTDPTLIRGVQHWTGSGWNDGKGGITGSVTFSADAGVTTGIGTVSVSGLTQFSPFVVVKAAAPLPIEILYFTAYVNGVDVVLDWTTVSEENNDYFSIQRSKDGKKFETIGTVPGAGTSNDIREYLHFDNKPYKGVNYYRLKQTDYDGQESFSEIVEVNVNTEVFEIVDIYPVPAESSVVITFISNSKDFVNLSIFDIAGKESMSDKYYAYIGFNSISVKISDLAKGVYFLHLEKNGERIHTKMLKD